MSKNPYPTHYRDYEKHEAKNQLGPTDNEPHSHGGPGSLPDQRYDGENDDQLGGAKTWTGDQSAFE